MEINRAAIKYNAKAAMQDAKPRSAMLVSFIYFALFVIIYALAYTISTPFYRSLAEHGNFQVISPFSVVSFFVYLALQVINSMIAAGFLIYCLRVSRYQPSVIGSLFDGFGIFFRLIALYIVEAFFIYLWSLLFIVPGIIASLRYSQAIYILIDHPEYSVMQCIRESKRLMDGRKGEYFVLYLSFLGWALLSIVPFVGIWTAPYMQITFCNYYNALSDLDRQSYNSYPELPNDGPGFSQ